MGRLRNAPGRVEIIANRCLFGQGRQRQPLFGLLNVIG